MLGRFSYLPLLSVGLTYSLWAVSGCGQEHSRLAKDDAGTGGQATTTTSTTGTAGSAGSTAAGGAGGDPEPDGPTVVSVVNGVVDADAVRLCFASFPSGESVDPWPSSGGLGFARTGRIDPINPTIPAGTDVQVFVLGGDLAQTTGKTCTQALALAGASDAAPALHVSTTGVLPASVFESERSLLISLYGCLGAPEHTHEAADQICGAGYAPEAPNVAMAVGFLSRQTSPSHVGMQFVHASAATAPSYLKVGPGIDGAVATMAVSQWSLGAIAPYPPYWYYSRATLGTVGEATLELSTNVSTPEHRASFADALDNSELEASDLVDELGFAFVMVGAASTMALEPGAWWHELTYTVLRSDP